MLRVILALSFVALGACRSAQPEPPCDVDALTKLGTTLASSSIADQADRVWPGIDDACEVPRPWLNYFDPKSLGDALPRERDPWIAALQRAACPEWESLRARMASRPEHVRAVMAFERCEFARYRVFTADEIEGSSSGIMTFAMHEWFLARGLDSGAIVGVTRALYAHEQLAGWTVERRFDLRWPKAHGVPLRDEVPIYVTRERAIIDDRGDRPPRAGQVLVVVADVETPMATILEILGDAGRTGFDRFGLFVEPERFVPTYIPVAVAEPLTGAELEPTEIPMLMSVEITDQV